MFQTCFPGEGTGTPLQYSCRGNPTDGGAWWAAAHGVTKSPPRLKRLSSSSSSRHVSPVALVVKNLSANVGDVRDADLIPGSRRSPGGEGTLVLLPGKSPWTEEPNGLQYIGSQTVGHD